MTNFIYDNQNDREIWQAYKAGDKGAFSYIYHTYYNDLYNYGLKLRPDVDMVCDCIQDFFLYLWRQREKLSDVYSIKYYLIKSFRRRFFHLIEKNKSTSLKKNAYQKEQANIVFSFEKKWVEDEQISSRNHRLLGLINKLTPKQKEVIFLKYYEDLSYKEIAEVMGLNYQTVVNHFYEAFQKLRKQKAFIWASLVTSLIALFWLS